MQRLAIGLVLCAATTVPYALGGPSSLLAAQTASPAFDVASIRRSPTLESGGSLRVNPGGRVSATNVPVRTLIVFAYGIKGHQLTGGPSWIQTDRYMVDASAESNPTTEQLRAMMRTLLADRFKLVTHRETQDVQGYELRVLKAGQLGPKLRRAAVNCSSAPSTAPLTPAQMTARKNCGFRERVGGLSAGDMGMPLLADILTNVAGGVVVDRTGLDGGFDLELTWADLEHAVKTGTDASSIFTALQEQLGLRLQAQPVPVEVIVIDRAERPTAN